MVTAQIETPAPVQWLELDADTIAGIERRISWNPINPTAWIRLDVHDCQTGADFRTYVAPNAAAHAFRHPMLYEPVHGPGG